MAENVNYSSIVNEISGDSIETLNAKSKNDFTTKINNLKILLEKDIDACDMKWTLFVAAAQSYRYDSRLKPFPPKFMNNEYLNIDELIKVINDTPTFKVILHNLIEDNIEDLNKNVVELLHWVLISLRDPYLRSVQKKDFEAVMSNVPSVLKGPNPTHIFKVRPLPHSIAEQKFLKHAKEVPTNFGYHGSNLDSFHSILNYGLQQHLSKRALFGEGIYLSSELHVSLPFSPFSPSWGFSRCGSNISCVALCEYAEHPYYLNCHIKGTKKQEVPEKYFVVTNNEIVRIRYLLIYGTDIGKIELKHHNPLYNWIIKNKTAFSMCCYALFLTSIGLINSRNGIYLRQLILRKVYAFFDSLKTNYFN